MTTFSPERVTGTFGAHPSLTERERRELERQGVPLSALERIRGGYIVHVGCAGFEFEQHIAAGCPQRAFLLLVCDVNGAPADIVAWQPATGWLGTWRGLAWALGQEAVYRPRLDEHQALQVHPDPLEWFKDGCCGVVLLRPRLAAAFLCDASPLVVADAEFGRELRSSLTRRSPRILVAPVDGFGQRGAAHVESALS